MNHDEIRQLLEAHALGTLDLAEQAAVEAHLPGCDECRQLVGEYAHVVDALPSALAAAAPAPLDSATRGRLLSRVRRPRRSLRVATAVATLASAAAVILLLWATQLSQALAAERALYAQLAGQQEIIFDVVDSPDATRVVLRPPVSGSTSYGKVFTRPDLPFVVAMAGRLPAPPEGKLYYLWLERSDGFVLAGTLPVDGEGFGALVYVDDRNGPAFLSARITLQPGGAKEPAGVPVLIWMP